MRSEIPGGRAAPATGRVLLRMARSRSASPQPNVSIRIASPHALLCAAALCVAGLLAPAGTAAACAGANRQPTRATLSREVAATRCLINRARARHGLAPLRTVRALHRAATAYSREMVRNDFFEHTSPDGSTPASRVRRSGYLRGATSWSVGETLAWGQGRLSTPAAIVRAWMHSPGHRAILLDGSFRDIGIGVAVGAPGVSGPAGTFTADLGVRG
jgi:uncharacterized protein YkwD